MSFALNISMKKLRGQIINLLKNIKLSKPESEKGLRTSFIPGPKGLPILWGVCITWWRTAAAERAADGLSFLLRDSRKEFEGCDLETIRKVIDDTLQEICLDPRYFVGKMLIAQSAPNLFECRVAGDVEAFADIIVGKIVSKLKLESLWWRVVYAAPRFKGNSFAIPDHGLMVIRRSDEDWQNTWDDKFRVDHWSPVTGNFTEGRADTFTNLSQSTSSYLFVYEGFGTQKGVLLNAQLALRQLFAVLYSVIWLRRRRRLLRAAAIPYRGYVQFPQRDAPTAGDHSGEIGQLVPFYSNDIELEAVETTDVLTWYRALLSTTTTLRSRIEKCAHFVNKALNSGGIDEYINYFIALDALYGERGSVEASIVDGITTLSVDSTWPEKTKWLFDLRNELVHGGSRHAREWSDYDRYQKHFGSKPENDVAIMACTALYHAPLSTTPAIS
jgi:hypothetical protein